jgi:hypothetical protein
MSQDDVQAAAELGDKIDRLKSQLVALGTKVGSAVVEPLAQFAELASEILGTVTKLAGTNPGLIKDIGGIGAAAVLAGGLVGGLGLGLAAISAHPIVAGITGLTALVMGLAKALGSAGSAGDHLQATLITLGFIEARRLAPSTRWRKRSKTRLANSASKIVPRADRTRAGRRQPQPRRPWHLAKGCLAPLAAWPMR